MASISTSNLTREIPKLLIRHSTLVRSFSNPIRQQSTSRPLPNNNNNNNNNTSTTIATFILFAGLATAPLVALFTAYNTRLVHWDHNRSFAEISAGARAAGRVNRRVAEEMEVGGAGVGPGFGPRAPLPYKTPRILRERERER